jgi:hypothetical protein
MPLLLTPVVDLITKVLDEPVEADILANLTRRITKPLRKRVVLGEDGVTREEHVNAPIFVEAYHTSVGTSLFRALWNKTITQLSQSERHELLYQFPNLIGLIEVLGGAEETAREIARAFREVLRWWPKIEQKCTD